MSKYQVRKEIAALIDSIKEHSDNIGENKYIPQLELESILSKIEKLYQKSILFNYLNSLPGEIDKTDGSEQKEKAREEMKGQVEIPVEKVSAPDLFGGELPPVSAQQKPEKKEEKKMEKVTKVTQPAIKDIKAAIGLNDKFQFTNELFRGNGQEYAIAIQQLNTSESFEEAMTYFLSLKLLYEWDMENDTVIRFLDLVNRRFS